jgi:hypothetical protein
MRRHSPPHVWTRHNGTFISLYLLTGPNVKSECTLPSSGTDAPERNLNLGYHREHVRRRRAEIMTPDCLLVDSASCGPRFRYILASES